MIVANILLGILFGILWVVLCFGTYAVLEEVYKDLDILRDFVDEHMSVRTRNIILRILVVLGPVVFLPLIFAVLIIALIPVVKACWEGFIDIDQE